MNNKALFALWGGLLILCAGLGFIPEPSGAARVALTALSLACFLPPAALLRRAARKPDRKISGLVRNLSALSLGLTLLLLILNFLSALRSELLGNILYGILIVVSSPMACSGYWALSLFLWACLLMVSLKQLRNCEKNPGKAGE